MALAFNRIKMYIRHATTKDAKYIAKIQVESWRMGYKGIMPDEYLKSLSVKEKTEDWNEALSKQGKGINLVIESNGIISGFSVYGPARDKALSNKNMGELVSLNVSPIFWGNGLGSELTKYVIESAYEYKWSSLCLWVIKKNTRARRLYEHLGFSVKDSEKIDTKLTGHELHEIRYVKSLNDRTRDEINSTI